MVAFGNSTCPEDNSSISDQTGFFDENGDIHWDAHRVGWAVAGGCAAATVILSLINVMLHATNYRNRAEQRQILRILYMPPVYAVISFFSYRFFRSYTYYELVETAYEAVTLSAFLLLIIEFVASTARDGRAELALERKEKRAMPLPFCCMRYRPTKVGFMYTLKWSVLQYVIIRPLITIVGIICEKLGVLCPSGGFNFHFAQVYLSIVDFFSISIALYGLFVFYGLTKEELVGRRPLAKFVAIKLIVMFTFYQSFVFEWLAEKVIKPTQFWTSTNIADGLNALAICIEMVFFSAFMFYAYPATEYKSKGEPRTNIFHPLWDSINYSDFAREIWGSFRFFFDYARGKPSAHGRTTDRTDFGQAFGVGHPTDHLRKHGQPLRGEGANSNGNYDYAYLSNPSADNSTRHQPMGSTASGGTDFQVARPVEQRQGFDSDGRYIPA